MLRAFVSLGIFLFLSHATGTAAVSDKVERFSGKVVAVEDGDTISVLHGSEAEKVRLFGIDCPEDGQAFSREARDYTSSQTLDRVVTVISNYKDEHGRTVARVILPDGRSLEHEIVKAGYGWWFEKYAPNDELLKDLQKEARAAGRGLWVDKQATPPWDYRTENQMVFVNKPGSKYHRASCSHLKRYVSISLATAKKRGFKPCPVCRP